MLLRAHQLSDREREVTQLPLTGRPTHVVAGQLSITLETLRGHVKSVYAQARCRQPARAGGPAVERAGDQPVELAGLSRSPTAGVCAAISRATRRAVRPT